MQPKCSFSPGRFLQPVVTLVTSLVVVLFSTSTSSAFQDGYLPSMQPPIIPDSSRSFPPPVAERQGTVDGAFTGNQQDFGQNDLRGNSPLLPARPVVEPMSSLTAPLALQRNPSERPLTGLPLAPPAQDRLPIVDPALQPVGYNTSAANTSGQQVSIAESLLNELSPAENSVQASSQPMGLLDILANSNSRQSRDLIKQYWQTYAAWAEYRFANEELRWIQQVGQVRTESDRLFLDAAQSAAQDMIAEKALELTRQQNLLNQFISGPRSETLPLPSDKPLVTRYRTNFGLYAARQTMPDHLRIIDEWLPQQQRLIGDRAATVQRCRSAVMQASREIAQGRPASSLLQTLMLGRECQNAFVKTVVEYNQSIAEYALSVKPRRSEPEQIVAMLIPVTPTFLDREFPNQTRQASLPDAPYRQQDSNSVQPLQPFNSGSNGSFGVPPRDAASTPPALNENRLSPTWPSSGSGQPNGGFRR